MDDMARATARQLADEWNLSLGEALPGATCSVVHAVGERYVLKVPYATAEEAGSWRCAMAFSLHGGVEVLRTDEASGALLMPRIRPGTTLNESGLTDLEQVDVCANLVLRLREAPLVEAIPLERWYKELDDLRDSWLVREARRAYLDLKEHKRTAALLHGDLHHFNILQDGNAWVAIDPKGLIGDPSFEVVGFMRNPIGATPGAGGMRARLRRFAERLGDPVERLWAWSFTQTVMCSGSPGTFGSACERAAKAIWEARP